MALFAKGITVVVADGQKAMVLVNEGTSASPRLVLKSKQEHKIGRNQDLLTDRPGRMPDPGAQQRSAMEAPDAAREAREQFATDLADRINRLNGPGALVIVAPPQILAVLRDNLSPQTRGRVLAELPKTLTHHTMDKIAAVVATDIDPV